MSSPGRRRRSREDGAGQRRSQSARHRVESAPVRMADLSGSRARMRSRRSSGSAEMRSSSAVAAASISSPSSPARRFFELDAPRNCAIVELLAAPTPRFLLGSPPLEISTSAATGRCSSRAPAWRLLPRRRSLHARLLPLTGWIRERETLRPTWPIKLPCACYSWPGPTLRLWRVFSRPFFHLHSFFCIICSFTTETWSVQPLSSFKKNVAALHWLYMVAIKSEDCIFSLNLKTSVRAALDCRNIKTV